MDDDGIESSSRIPEWIQVEVVYGDEMKALVVVG